MTDIQSNNANRKPQIWVAIVVVIVLLGIAYQIRTVAKKNTNFAGSNSTGLSSSIGAASPEAQTSAEHTLQTFLEDVRRQNYDQALKATANGFPTPRSAAGLKAISQNQSFSPILAAPLTFEPAHIGSHGHVMILRASFRSGGKAYRTVCTFRNEQGTWLISNILDPVPPSAPPTSQSSGGSKAP